MIIIDTSVIGKNIKRLWKSKRLTQTVLAERIDTSRNYISDIECGNKSPGFKTIIKITDALGVDIIRKKSIGVYSENIKEAVYIEAEFDITEDDFGKYKEVLKPRELDYIKFKFRDGISTKRIAQNLNIIYTNATTLWYEIKKKFKKFIKK